MSSDDKPTPDTLEAELRQDRLPDPGEAFFADLERRVLQQVSKQPAPRRPWWTPSALWRFFWQPAPVAALVGAAAVALVVVWMGGPGGPQEAGVVTPRGTTTGGVGAGLAARPTPIRRTASGEAWFAQLPPTEDLWAVEDRDLPALLALLSTPGSEADDVAGPPAPDEPVDEPVDDRALDHLSEDQLRALDRVLKQQQTRKKRRPTRPRPPMGKAMGHTG